MHILLIAPHPFYQQRGSPIAERALLEVLVSAGHQVDVLTLSEGEDPGLRGCRMVRLPDVPGLRGMRPGPSAKKLVADVLLVGQAIRLCRNRRYDLVHAVEEAAFIALLLRRLFGIPFVYDMDSWLVEQLVERYGALRPVRALLEWVERAPMRRSAAVLTVCRALEELVRERAPGQLVGRIEDCTLLTEDGVGSASGTERLSETIGVEGPIVLYVGNLQPYQGIDLLLEAHRHTVERVPEARLVVIGGGEEGIRSYRRRARELSLEDRVHLVGRRPLKHLGHYLGQADVVVSPRVRGRNTPLKIYSYLDSGRPLVATRLPTHTQVLTDEVARLAEPVPADLGRAVAGLLRRPEDGARLAAAAKELVRREFSPEAFRRKLLDFYGRLEERLQEGGLAERSVKGGLAERPAKRGLAEPPGKHRLAKRRVKRGRHGWPWERWRDGRPRERGLEIDKERLLEGEL